MKKIDHLGRSLKDKLIDILYEDEVFNVFLIHHLENDSLLGELYINEIEGLISTILHLKFDGNSYFTSFYSNDELGLDMISRKLKTLNYPNILLAGKSKDVLFIMNSLNINRTIYPNKFYQLNPELFSYEEKRLLKKASIDDLEILKPFYIDFFEAKTNDEIYDITNRDKLEEDIETGVYLYEVNKTIIGMARFSSFSKHFCDITTVYIKPKYRNLGHGKILMKNMVIEAFKIDKIPLTQTSIYNISAKKTYESIGFIAINYYAFEFISKKSSE